MSRYLISSCLIATLLCACSHHPPAETAAAPAATAATPAPQAGQPGAAVNALLTESQLKALQKAHAVEPQVMQQKDDMDKKIDAETGKN